MTTGVHVSWTALRRPSLKTALVMNQAPMGFFAVAILVVTAFLFVGVHDRTQTLLGSLEAGGLVADDITATASSIRLLWMASLVGFLAFLGGVSGVSLWVHRRMARRLDEIVDYAERRLGGHDVAPLPVVGSDVLSRVEGAIMAVSDESAARAEALRAESETGHFDAQLQRAFDLAGNETQTLDIVHRALKVILPGQAAQILMADSSQAHLRPMDGSAPGCSVERPVECAAVRRGAPLVFGSSETLDACPMLRDRGAACSAVCSPLTVMGRTVGVLHVTGEDGQPPGDTPLRLLSAMATHTGNRLSVLRTLAGAQLQASTDPLTGLLNRRSFEERASRVLREHGDDAHSLVMCDLDHFKRLNDTAGHEAGDRALKLFARLLKTTLRAEDIIGRHGGEEFVIMLPGCDPDQGARLIERLRDALNEASGSYDGPSFTASFGMASFARDGIDVPELVRSADRALYAAKNAGRDRLMHVAELRLAANG